jgi:hypothetical protein
VRHEIRVLGELGSEFERIAAVSRQRWSPLLRWRPFALVFVLLLGGTAGALAATGVFQLGSPFGASTPQNPYALDGVVSRGSSHVLALSVPDPQGGPPWALRVDHTTRGLLCVQYGRRGYGTIGILGIDHAFNDDGRFHPLALDANQDAGQGCATTDADGHGFISVTVQAVAASGLQYSCHSDAASLFANSPDPAAFRHDALKGSGPLCPAADLRDIYYGLLGPDATSVTYLGESGHLVTEKTTGPDGAYLVLGPPSDVMCSPGGGCGNGDTSGPGLNPGFITSVTYSNGYVCRIAARGNQIARATARYRAALAARFPALAIEINHRFARLSSLTARQLDALRRTVRSKAYQTFVRSHAPRYEQAQCPLLGYVAPQVRHVTTADVATPITVHLGKVAPECTTHGRRFCTPPVLHATISFVARVAVTNIDSHYEVNAAFIRSGPCPQGGGGGSFGSTNTDLRAGQRVTQPVSQIACPGVIRGTVVYSQNNGPSTDQTVPHLAGQSNGVLVGRFAIQVP